MIFVPDENDVDFFQKQEQFKTFKWCFGCEENQIIFEWNKQSDKWDSFYLHPVYLGREKILQCPESACQCYPQLRYNKIIDKWYCNCSSSAICTNNTDQSELDELIKSHVKFNTIDESHGFFNDPIKALLFWNVSVAESLLNLNQKLLNSYNKNGKLTYGGLYG